jgi:hypothetical protein
MAQNELDKLYFEGKKIFVTQVEDLGEIDSVSVSASATTTATASKKSEMEDDCEPGGATASKKPRFEESNTTASDKKHETIVIGDDNVSSFLNLGTRRSKRARKNKKDIELTASSYNTVKQIKQQVKETYLTEVS